MATWPEKTGIPFTGLLGRSMAATLRCQPRLKNSDWLHAPSLAEGGSIARRRAEFRGLQTHPVSILQTPNSCDTDAPVQVSETVKVEAIAINAKSSGRDQDAIFVVVIMAMASSLPIVRFTETAIAKFSAVGKGTHASWWLAILTENSPHLRPTFQTKKSRIKKGAGQFPFLELLPSISSFSAQPLAIAHYPVLVILGILFFLAFVSATRLNQQAMALRPALLVGFFLAALIIHGGCQQWWIGPVLGGLSKWPLMLAATILTAFNDNAAITYLATLVPHRAGPFFIATTSRRYLATLSGGPLAAS